MRRLTCALTLLLLAACSSESGQPSSASGGQAGTAAGGNGASAAAGNGGKVGTAGGEGRPVAGGSGGSSAGAGGELVSGGAAGDSAGLCLGDLAQLGQDCLPSFDGTAAELPPCDALVPDTISYWIYPCGDTVSYELGSGFSSLVCTYAQSSHALVGVLEAGDTPGYCDGQSFTIQAGEVPSPSCHTPDSGTACGAAGAAGADGDPVK